MDRKKRRVNSKGRTKKEQTEYGREVMEKLLNSMQNVNLNATDAKANEHSMDDNNGGRILYVLIDGKKYQYIGNRKKTLELLRLLEGSLIAAEDRTHEEKKRSGNKKKLQ